MQTPLRMAYRGSHDYLKLLLTFIYIISQKQKSINFSSIPFCFGLTTIFHSYIVDSLHFSNFEGVNRKISKIKCAPICSQIECKFTDGPLFKSVNVNNTVTKLFKSSQPVGTSSCASQTTTDYQSKFGIWRSYS